jgi:hypothetical protein
MVREERHARNAERKALKRHQKEQKMEQERQGPQNKGARTPIPTPQRNAGKGSKGPGRPGRR